MLKSNSIDPALYAELMAEIKKLNFDYRRIRKSREYKIGLLLNSTVSLLRQGKFGELKRKYSQWFGKNSTVRTISKLQLDENFIEYELPKPEDYFSKDRVAVYTVVFGKYDEILEPYCAPDNIDYYIITDLNIDLSHSKWKKVDISSFADVIKSLTNIEKNRYFKMNPSLVFSDYRYSVYIDGNILVVSDFTEFINKIGAPDIATHMHNSRDCVYEESKAVVAAGKEKKEIIAIQMNAYKNAGMPEKNGLLECNVIARRHTEQCNKLMQQWWAEFLKYSRRDQISLPYILFKNKINVSDVATLGPNVLQNPALRWVPHS